MLARVPVRALARAMLGLGALLASACGGGATSPGPTPSAAAGWTPAQVVAQDQAGTPALALDASGNGLAVWADDAGRVRASRFSAGAWSAATTIGEPFVGAAQLKVAFDVQGRAIAVWSLRLSGRIDVLAARYQPASGWSAPEGLVPSGLANVTDTIASSGDLAVALDGHAIVAWRQVTPEGHRLWARRFAPASGWSAPEMLAAGRGNASRPRVAGDGRGTLFVAWHTSDAGTADARAVRAAAGEGFGPIAVLRSAPGLGDQSHPPEIAVSQTGDAFVVWPALVRDEPAPLWVARYAAGSGWEAARPVPSAGFVVAPVVAADAQGAALVVWNQEVPGQLQVWASRFAPFTGWEAARRLDNLQPPTPTFPFTSVPRVAVDPRGNGVAIWVQARPDLSQNDIYAARYSAGGGWGAALAIDSGAVAGPGEVALDASGNALAVWTQGDFPVAQVWSSRLPSQP